MSPRLDPEEPEKRLHLAEECNNDSEACYEYGLMWLRGVGGPTNAYIAEYLIEKACNDGCERACNELSNRDKQSPETGNDPKNKTDVDNPQKYKFSGFWGFKGASLGYGYEAQNGHGLAAFLFPWFLGPGFAVNNFGFALGVTGLEAIYYTDYVGLSRNNEGYDCKPFESNCDEIEEKEKEKRNRSIYVHPVNAGAFLAIFYGKDLLSGNRWTRGFPSFLLISRFTPAVTNLFTTPDDVTIFTTEISFLFGNRPSFYRLIGIFLRYDFVTGDGTDDHHLFSAGLTFSILTLSGNPLTRFAIGVAPDVPRMEPNKTVDPNTNTIY